ncbi:MAG: DUF4476 domain-containing protein [Bernardetiaceae bacterium]|nr:DUF4476 domain-containing protein [Bernardetiaceae bacterium]
MKHLSLLTFLFCLFWASVEAQPANLRIRSNTHAFVVVINGQAQSFTPQREVFLNNLRAGMHNIELRLENQGRTRNNTFSFRTAIFLQPATAHSYTLDYNENQQIVFMPEGMQGGFFGGGGMGGGGMMPDECPNTFTDSEFRRYVRSIENQSFSEGKLAVARQGLRQSNLYTDQAIEVMRLFSFDPEKLEFAKMVYTRLCDTHNAHLLNDGFSFSSSVREFSRFLDSQN